MPRAKRQNLSCWIAGILSSPKPGSSASPTCWISHPASTLQAAWTVAQFLILLWAAAPLPWDLARKLHRSIHAYSADSWSIQWMYPDPFLRIREFIAAVH